MAGNFLVRPEKLITKRSLTDADKTTASTTWVAVAGTRVKFTLGKDSLLEFKVQGVLSASGGAAAVDVDVAIDGKLIGFDALPAGPAGAAGATHGLLTQDIAAAGKFVNFSLETIIDTLAEGEHSFEIFYQTSANTAVINAAATDNPLRFMLLEHASAYPATQPSAY